MADVNFPDRLISASGEVARAVGLYLGIGTSAPSANLHVNGTARIGSATTNYTEFESDGTMVMNGNATVWNDFVTPIIASRVAAVAPDYASMMTGIYQYQFKVGDSVSLSTELMHDYKQGSTVEVHVHASTGGAQAVSANIRWEFCYSVQNMAATAPFSIYPSSTTIYGETNIPTGTSSLAHVYTSLGTVALPSALIGAVLVGTLTRISAISGAILSANPFGLDVGIHYEIDTIGSRERATK